MALRGLFSLSIEGLRGIINCLSMSRARELSGCPLNPFGWVLIREGCLA